MLALNLFRNYFIGTSFEIELWNKMYAREIRYHLYDDRDADENICSTVSPIFLC